MTGKIFSLSSPRPFVLLSLVVCYLRVVFKALPFRRRLKFRLPRKSLSVESVVRFKQVRLLKEGVN